MTIKIGIYGIFCLVNNGVYIGKTNNKKGFMARWGAEKRYLKNNNDKKINSHLLRAWNKYGKENFEFKIIEECSTDDINKKEVYWIEHYRKNNYNVYNFTDGGDGGFKMSQEHKQKISNALKGRIFSEEHRKNLSIANKGRIISKETREKMSKIQTGKRGRFKHSEEHKRKMSEIMSGEKSPMFGKKMSEENKQRLREMNSGENHPQFGTHHSEETLQKIREAVKGKLLGDKHPMFGKHHSEESKQKMRKSHIGKKASEETKRKISENHSGMIGKHHSEETRKRLSEITKLQWASGQFKNRNKNL